MYETLLDMFLMFLSSRLTITLELNGEIVSPWKKVNSTTMMFRLFNVQIPRSKVLCKLRNPQLSLVVAGLDLRGGRMYLLTILDWNGGNWKAKAIF